MTKRLYLHRKRERLYFRRRIPGLSTSTAPVSLALGMTDAALGHMWTEHLSQEFDRMLEQFIFMSPPLPEHLVARYFESCLAEILHVLQRNLRLARMSGRISEAYLPNREIQALVLQSLVEDGVNRYLPAKRVDPAWTTSQLDLAVRIYAHEAREILSREHDNKLAAGFAEHSDLPLLSLEHKAQLREAYLSARLVALRTFQLEKPSHERALSSRTEKPDGHVTARPPETSGSKGGGAGLSQETPFKMENTESPAEVRSDVEAGKVSGHYGA